jgi:hypothetical protein
MTITCTLGKDGRKYYFKDGKRVSKKQTTKSKSVCKKSAAKKKDKSKTTNSKKTAIRKVKVIKVVKKVATTKPIKHVLIIDDSPVKKASPKKASPKNIVYVYNMINKKIGDDYYRVIGDAIASGERENLRQKEVRDQLYRDFKKYGLKRGDLVYITPKHKNAVETYRELRHNWDSAQWRVWLRYGQPAVKLHVLY